jgi:beta-lactamase class A
MNLKINIPHPHSREIRRLLVSSLLLVLLVSPISVCLTTSPSQAKDSRASQSFESLRLNLETLIRDNGAGVVGVAFHDLESDAEILIGAEQEFHAASTMKIRNV